MLTYMYQGISSNTTECSTLYISGKASGDLIVYITWQSYMYIPIGQNKTAIFLKTSDRIFE